MLRAPHQHSNNGESLPGSALAGEKRNATEIMHAYLGTGLEVLSDKGRGMQGYFVEFGFPV